MIKKFRQSSVNWS